MVKRSERPPVSKGVIQLCVPPGRRKDRGRSESPMSMKSLGQELSQLAARKPVQEFKQRFLDHAAGSSAGMSMSQPVYNGIEAERRLAESWAQVEADDRATREQMESEEAKYITQAKEEKVKQEAKHIEEQLKPILEFKQKFLASRKQSVPEAPATQEVQEPEVEKTALKKVDSPVGQVPRHSGEGVETTISFGCPRVKDPNDPWFGLMLGHSAPSGHSASGESTPPSTLIPVTQPVEQPAEVGSRGTISTI